MVHPRGARPLCVSGSDRHPGALIGDHPNRWRARRPKARYPPSTRMSPSVLVTKRVLDILAAVVGLALTLPLYPVLAAIVYLDSPGPIFYRQRRAGKLLGTDTAGGPVWDE